MEADEETQSQTFGKAWKDLWKQAEIEVSKLEWPRTPQEDLQSSLTWGHGGSQSPAHKLASIQEKDLKT